MKRQFLLATLFMTTIGLLGQQLTNKEIQIIQNSFVKDAPTIALQNILTTNKDIQSLSINHNALGKIDHFFKYKVDVKGITDQHSSGRCWMFTSMNVLRPTVMKKFNISEFDFSHNYSYFWDIFEKSNLFLENIIRTADKDFTDREVEFYFKSPVSDGGVWNLFYNVAEKYGVVPQQVMPETAHSNNTRQMISIINERLRIGGYSLRNIVHNDDTDTIKNTKILILKDIYRILALCLGEPPMQFEWRYQSEDGLVHDLQTTPLDFYHSIIPSDYNPDSYIMIMNDPTREYYRVYEIQNYRNSEEGINWIYLNLPNDVIKTAALASIKDNRPMYTSCDVNKFFNRNEGISDPGMYDYESLFGINLQSDKKARILTRQSGSSHAMTLIAVDTDNNDKPIKWEFENSWGTEIGNKGYITFTDKWFDEYMFRIVIEKKYLDKKSIQASKTEPVVLPAWDYMF